MLMLTLTRGWSCPDQYHCIVVGGAIGAIVGAIVEVNFYTRVVVGAIGAIIEVNSYTRVVGGAIGVHQHPLPPSPGQDSSSHSSLVRTSEGHISFLSIFQTDIF